MDGGHEPLNNAKLVVDHLCQRSKAVGGTGGVAREKRRQLIREGWDNLRMWALPICDELQLLTATIFEEQLHKKDTLHSRSFYLAYGQGQPPDCILYSLGTGLPLNSLHKNVHT